MLNSQINTKQLSIIAQNLLQNLQKPQHQQNIYIVEARQIINQLIKLILNIDQLLAIQSQQQYIQYKATIEFNNLKHKKYFIQNKINQLWFSKSINNLSDIFEKMLNSNNLTDIYVQLQGLRFYRKVFIYAATFPEKDLFSLHKSCSEWKDINKYTTYKKFISTESMIEQLVKLQKLVKIINSVLQQLQETNNSWKKFYIKTLGMGKYFIFTSIRNRKSIQFNLTSTCYKRKRMLSFLEQGLIQKFLNFSLQKILYFKNIYIKRLFPKITKKSVKKLIASPDLLNLQLQQPQNTLQNSSPSFLSIPQTIQITILSNSQIQRKKQQCQSQTDASFIILHIHGGGFIGSSPKVHQSYTRKWAKQCKIPVFSINYRKAPENPFPSAVDDVWQAYNWLLNYSDKYFRIKKIKKVLVIGDSAGGNLAITLTNLAIMNNIQLPLYTIPFYPVTNINTKNFTPSYLSTFYDPGLTFNFIDMMDDVYSQGWQQKQKNYLMSPLFTPDEILKKYPPTTIFIGQKDVLHDDTIRFGLKLWKNKVKINVVQYMDMIHGFISFSSVNQFTIGKQCVNDSINLIKQIIGKQ